jgi:hypothetical protein
VDFEPEGFLMKRLPLLLLLTVMIGGCGRTSSDVQTAASGLWQAQLLGGESPADGFSFTAQFNVSGTGGALTFPSGSFQFLTQGPCFPVNGITPTGTMNLTVNVNNYEVTGTFTMTVVANGNTLTLSGNVSGNENSLYGLTLSNGLVTGTWTLAGSNTNGCVDTSGSFTMTQASSGTT